MKHLICVFMIFLGCFPGEAQQQWPGGSERRRTEAPHYRLLPGKVQLAGRFGGSYLHRGAGRVQPSFGGELVVGLPHNLALFAEGTRHHSVDLGVRNLRLGADLYDLGGGVEWNIPNRTRVVPYLRGGAGLVHVNTRVGFHRHNFWASGSNFAGNLGVGLRIHLKENYGPLVDMRAFQGPDLPWMARTSFGFFYRFK